MGPVQYLLGTVRVQVRGSRPEKWINICLNRRLPVWNVQIRDGTPELSMLRGDYRRNARAIGRKTGCRSRVLARSGLSETLRKLRHRKALWITAVLACAFVCFLNSLVWSVEVVPGERATEADVARTERLLVQYGVNPGVFLDALHTKETAELLLQAQKDLCWVRLQRCGTRIRVEIERGVFYTDAEPIPQNVPCDMIAEKDCEILKCTVYQGSVRCKPGAVVHAGETLVAGFADGVHAQADIMARTWYTVRLPVERETEMLRETGRSETENTLFLFGLRIPLPSASRLPWRSHLSDAQSTQTRTVTYWTLPGGLRLPIGVCRTTRTETVLEPTVLDDGAALAYTRMRAADLLDAKIPDNAAVLGTSFRVMEDENGRKFYEIAAECAEPVGVCVRPE